MNQTDTGTGIRPPDTVHPETRRTDLTLFDQEQITSRLDSIGMHLSEFSFSNLYLFRNTHSYQKIETPNGVFISGSSYDKKPYLMPLSGPEHAGQECFQDLRNLLATREWDFVFPIPEEWITCFPDHEFDKTSNPDDSDYLYRTEKFKTYPGKRMHKKRNLLNQYLANSHVSIRPFEPSMMQDTQSLLDLWQHTSPQEIATSDYHQCLEALQNLDTLNLTCAVSYANNKAQGFIIGEALNADTFTIHFAKADISLKGAYQYLFSAFAREFCPDYQYMNLEQDLGHEGLRKTKVSYRPDLMAHKYRVSLKHP